MGKINVLSPHVADMIAAGEVVERPASVVKELTENAIDAGATAVTVECTAGGMTYLRVTDNGCGMSPQDAATAFLRHATSKLHDERGLEAIGTLGFRGEALAAISAVSRVDLLTRETGADQGVSLSLEAGKIVSSSPAGCPEGTTIIVRDLFYNTPARQKFMKSDRAEASAVTAAVVRLALSHPEVSVRYLRDGKQELHSPGDGRLDSVVYSVFGRDFARTMLPVSGDDGAARVTGYISAPASCRGNRTNQFFFVNGRCVKSKTLQTALEQAYRNSLFTGKYPSCVLYLTLSCAAVDVNVHPAKTEVRFLSDRQVFDSVYYACAAALEQEKPGSADVRLTGANQLFSRRPARESEAPPSGTLRASSKPSGDFFKTVRAEDYAKQAQPRFTPAPRNAPSFVASPTRVSETYLAKEKAPAMQAEPEKSEKTAPPEPEQAQQRMQELPDAPAYRLIGEAMRTYLIVECGSSLWLIDKHAAHERMNFDRLKQAGYEPMGQQLIEPVICRLGAQDLALLLDNAQLLERFAIELEQFSPDSVAVRQLPADVDTAAAESLLEELCDALRDGGHADENARLDNILHTVACKSAIKAGSSTEPGSLDRLIAAVLSGQVRYCPHGRPVAVELTKAALDKSFKRTQ